MKSAVFITVRTDSSRLPNKALLPILGKPSIMMVMLRAKLVKNADNVVVCTTPRPVDDAIIKLSEKCGVQSYRGSLEDKLDRWLGAAKHFGIDCFVTMDGDDLLCDPELMEMGLNQIIHGNYDFIEAPAGLICGSFTYALRTSAVEKVCDIKGTDDTEMMWVYFKDTGMFRVGHLHVSEKLFFDHLIRMTLDYSEDYDFFKAIFEHFGCVGNDLSIRAILPFLRSNPNVVKKNAFRQEDWAKNQKRRTKLILKEDNPRC